MIIDLSLQPCCRTINTFKRHIGSVGNGDGPTILVVSGLHGNEPSGVEACQRIIPELERTPLKGKVVFLTGNINALERNVRMVDHDLNRVWQTERVERDLVSGPLDELGEEAQDLHELNLLVQELFETEKELILLDLHTTSAQTIPFLTMTDTLVNREFIQGLGVPVVIGIEEYLSGPLLSHVMEHGHVSMAFESGSHLDPGSADRHYHFLWIGLEKAGVLKLNNVVRNEHLKNISFSDSLSNAVFDVRHREEIKPGEQVQVLPGFRNFDIVKPGQKLAQKGGDFVRSNRHCRIFMPLYQTQGSEAYFLIGRMPKWWKFLSRFSRKNRFDKFIAVLPGVTRISERQLRISQRTARSRAKHILHLVGYRNLQAIEKDQVFIRREL